jgi:Cu-Zn family superoxide dismutase
MRFAAAFLVASTLALAACSDRDPVADDANVALDDPALENIAVANDSAAMAPAAFTGANGESLGTVAVAEGPGGVTLQLAGIGMPAGDHGLHVHGVGKCEGPKFESAGDHWNPDGKKHGKDNPAGPHKGDLPNVTVGPDGALSQPLTLAGATMADLHDADGSALVVHARADDNRTDPSGNSGDRIACAVIAPPR